MQNYQKKLTVAEQEELLQSALDESHRLHRYVENLLQATKIHHSVQLNTHPQSILPLLHTVMLRFDTSRLKLQYSTKLPCVALSAALFEQALYNIIDNALRYSPSTSTVNIHLYAQETHLIADISDQGPGIAAEARDKIFELFFSSRQGDTGEGGSGLGLAVAKAIIDAHFGSLTLVNREQGCCMRISLPTIAGQI